MYIRKTSDRAGSSILMSALLALILGAGVPSATFAQDHHDSDDEHSSSRFSDEPIPLADLPERPKPLLELGEPFLGTGTLTQGFRLPTGAVWQPALLAFGTLRSAAQSFQLSQDAGDTRLSEAAFRFDLFGNLYLTATERVLIGFRPLDEDGAFTRFTFDSDPEILDPDCIDEEGFQTCNDTESFEEELNFGIRTLFFEGDFGELFPAFDWQDKRALDIGISVGRQPLSFQDGLLINENAIDAVGLTRANLKFKGLVNMRVTGLFGWGDINRTAATNFGFDNIGDKSSTLFGLFTETDTRKTTIEADVIYVSADDLQGDGLYAGISSTRRYGKFSNTWRAVGSFTIGDEGLHNNQGYLFTNQLSWTPHHTYNHVYVNVFAGIDEFRSAARGPANGGPLGLVGILYSAVGIGRFPPALGGHADNAFGGAFGYQFFFAQTRQQLIVEVGGRNTYDMGDLNEAVVPSSQVAGGARYQIALARRGVLVFDAFGLYNIFDADTDLDLNSFFVGGRLELVIQL